MEELDNPVDGEGGANGKESSSAEDPVFLASATVVRFNRRWGVMDEGLEFDGMQRQRKFSGLAVRRGDTVGMSLLFGSFLLALSRVHILL